MNMMIVLNKNNNLFLLDNMIECQKKVFTKNSVITVWNTKSNLILFIKLK